MRIWTGQEMEGPLKGKLTLFVECHEISPLTIKEIKKFFENPVNSEYKNIYIGAGRINTSIFLSMWGESLFKYLKEKSIQISYETTNFVDILSDDYCLKFLLKHDVMLICRMEVDTLVNKFLKNILIKLDDMVENVYISDFKEFYYTNIEELNNGIYIKDKIIIGG